MTDLLTLIKIAFFDTCFCFEWNLKQILSSSQFLYQKGYEQLEKDFNDFEICLMFLECGLMILNCGLMFLK